MVATIKPLGYWQISPTKQLKYEEILEVWGKNIFEIATELEEISLTISDYAGYQDRKQNAGLPIVHLLATVIYWVL